MGRSDAKYITQTRPDAKIAILIRRIIDKKVVVSSYEVTEPTIDSHVVLLKSSGADAFLVAGTPKLAAQAIKKADEIGWAAAFHQLRVQLGILDHHSRGTGVSVGVVAATITAGSHCPP